MKKRRVSPAFCYTASMTAIRRPMPPDARMVFKGELFEVWQWQQTMFDGTTGTFERLRRADAAEVIATVGNAIIILEQQQPDTGTFLSLPGGRFDGEEDALTAAKRELLEETGYASDDWNVWDEIRPSGKIEWTLYDCIARDCRKVSEPHLDAGEKISLRLVSFEEFLTLADDPLFRSTHLLPQILRARYEPAKREELHCLLFG